MDRSNTLAVTINGRPAFAANKHGIIAAIGVHDTYHLLEKSRFKQRLMTTHPDRTPKGGSQHFRRAQSAYRSWIRRELIWYGEFGLKPPR